MLFQRWVLKHTREGVRDFEADVEAQETAELEAQAYELEQKTLLAAEAKNVLESWVRYEGQVKQRQQQELATSIIAKIDKELEDPKTLKRILDQSVADIEREILFRICLLSLC